jgi:hypothetical protein
LKEKSRQPIAIKPRAPVPYLTPKHNREKRERENEPKTKDRSTKRKKEMLKGEI